jgi:type III secretory pathway component EscV
MARFFPFMLLAIVAYGITVAAMGVPLAHELMTLGLPSGTVFVMTVSELLLAIATAVLFFEIMNATSARSSSIVNHALSMVVFIACGLIFLFVPGFGTGTFMIITLMALVDVIAGYSISILTARRDMTFGDRE